MCHGRSWTPMDLAAQRLRDKAWRKRCAARLEASCPWIVHVSSMVYTRPNSLRFLRKFHPDKMMEHIDHDYLSTQVIQIPSKSKSS